MALSHTFVLNLKLKRLCLAKKTLKDCGSSTKQRANQRSLHQELLLQAAEKIEKRKNGLRKPSSYDNMQIIIVKFVEFF